MKIPFIPSLQFTLIALAVAFAFFVYCFALYFLYYSPDSPKNTVTRNMAAAAEHIPLVEKLLRAENCFAKIRLVSYTGDGGCLGVFGKIESQQALDELMKLVNQTSPSVHVHWEVKIVAAEKPWPD